MTIKFIIVLIAISTAVSFPIFATAQLITVEFSKIKDKATGRLVHNLVFKRGKEIIAKRIYSNGKTILSEGKIPDGMVVESYPNGKAKNIMFYMNGERNGPAISLYENGKLKGQTYYKDDNPTRKGFYYFGFFSRLVGERLIDFQCKVP
jgi:hypothetical protein